MQEATMQYISVEARNDVFLEHQGIIRSTIRRNISLLLALRLNLEDVSQDLAVAALRAIKRYSPDRGMSLKNYLFNMLQYAVLDMNQRVRRQNGWSAGYNVIPLVWKPDDDDEGETDRDIPVHIDFDDGLFADEMLTRLTQPERDTLNTKLAGERLTTDRQRRHFDRLKRKVYKFYVYPNQKSERRAAR